MIANEIIVKAGRRESYSLYSNVPGISFYFKVKKHI